MISLITSLSKFTWQLRHFWIEVVDNHAPFCFRGLIGYMKSVHEKEISHHWVFYISHESDNKKQNDWNTSSFFCLTYLLHYIFSFSLDAANHRQNAGSLMWTRLCGPPEEGLWEPTSIVLTGAMTKASCATTVTHAKQGCWQAWKRVGGRFLWSTSSSWSSWWLCMWSPVRRLGTTAGSTMMNPTVRPEWRRRSLVEYISNRDCCAIK